MCGIAGIVDPTWEPVDRAVLRAMTDALTSRGPDGDGFWHAPGVGLGHRRLRVIDLSTVADQPMGNEDGSVQVVFNGEIYNFADLRAELLSHGHTFRSKSDTEVLVHGYETWGDDLVSRIDGMFAFALWDAKHRRLLCARDRMGKKPLYYTHVARPGRPPLFAFGSELKALLPVPGFDRSISPAALARYLSFEYVPPPHAILAGARKLDAGEMLVLDCNRDPDRSQVRRYWDFPFPREHAPCNEADAVAQLQDLLRRAVEKRLVADVPLGAFLSGGLDSSTTVAFMAEMAGADRVKTFSIGFSDASFDETSHARAVAQQLGTDHKAERLDAQTLIDVLPNVGRFLDEPLGDASIIPTYLLCKFVRQHVTVALSGDGGDELFAGYPTFVAEKAAHVFFDTLPSGVQRLARFAAGRLPAKTDYFSLDFKLNQFLRGGAAPGPRRHQRWMASFLPEELPRVLTPGVWQAAGGDPLDDVDARARVSPARDPSDLLMDFYARFYLAGDVNVKVDRAAGAVGLEVRAPLLDTDLVKFACQLPPNLRLRGLTTKYLLKKAMRGRLPRAITDRKKQGFGVPVARWMRHELAPALRDELAPDKLRREGLLDPTCVQGLIDDHLQGRRDRRKALWTLFVFQRWLATWQRPPV